MPGMPDPVTEPPNQNLSSAQATNSQAMSDQVSTRTANVPPPNPLKPRAASVPFELPSANTSVGYAYDTQMLLHTSSTEHPECPARIKQIHRTLREQGLIKMMRLIPVRMVRKTEVLLVHSEDHWEKVEAISRMCRSVFHLFREILSRYGENLPNVHTSGDCRNDTPRYYRLGVILRTPLSLCLPKHTHCCGIVMRRCYRLCPCSRTWALQEDSGNCSSPRPPRRARRTYGFLLLQ